MDLFFCPVVSEEASVVTLDEFESRHIARTLRKKTGDRIALTDGQGGHYSGEITSLKPRVRVHILERTKHDAPQPALHAAMGFIKPQRLEWALEKVTELGATDIHLIRTEHSGYGSANHGRFEKILRQALKQNQRFYLPALHLYKHIHMFIAAVQAVPQKFVAVDAHFPPLAGELQNEGDRLICVGPEGGLSQTEIGLLQDNGFKAVSLGPSRLRAETALLAGLSVLRLL